MYKLEIEFSSYYYFHKLVKRAGNTLINSFLYHVTNSNIRPNNKVPYNFRDLRQLIMWCYKHLFDELFFIYKT